MRWFFLALIGFTALLLGVDAQADSASPGFGLADEVMASSIGTSVSPGYGSDAIIGQSSPVGESSSANFAVNGGTAIKSYNLTVTKAGTGEGIVISTPAGINCDPDCTETYSEYTSVTLTASPYASSIFTGWSGDCAGTGTCTLKMTADQTANADFTLKTYTITATAGSNGTITPSGVTTVNYDGSQTYTITPDIGYHVADVKVDDVSVGAVTSYNFIHVIVNHTINATFAITTHNLTVTKTGTGTGTVTSIPAGITCGPDCTETYNENTSVTLTATPDASSTFTGWSGACVGTGACTFAMTADKTATADFKLKTITLLTCPDGGAIECLEREDGGDESENLVDGKPGILEYKFITNVKDTDGTPKYVRVFTTQRSNPKPEDFYGHDMSCLGDYAAGATCTYKTKFGPAYTHLFYLEAKMANETILRYPVKGTVKGPDVYLLNEYSMVSLPRDITSANLDGAKGFGTEWVYRYDGGDAGQYSPVSDAYPARTGEGYFLWNDQVKSTLIELAQYPDISAAEYTYELQPGWNLISNPYSGNIRLEDIMVKQGNDTPVPWVDAISDPNRWLYQSLYYYNGIDWGDTYNHEEIDGEPFATLVPWMGYFIYLYDIGDGNNYSLVIPRPVSSSAPAQVVDGWKMDIIVKVNNAENRLVVGQIADASDEKDGRYDVPAYLNGDIKAYFILQDKTFWNDIRKSCRKGGEHCIKTWNLFVESEKENETIAIKWNNAGLPENINIRLVDVSARKVTDMRQATEYSYKNTGKRSFIVITK